MALFDFFKKNKNETPQNNITEFFNEEQIEKELEEETELMNDSLSSEERVLAEIDKSFDVTSESESRPNFMEEDESDSEDASDIEEIEESKEIEDIVSDELPSGEQVKKGLFSKIISGLDKTRKNILGNVESVLKSFTKIDEELYDELEEALIAADIGVNTSMELIERLRKRVKSEKIVDVQNVRGALIEEITDMLVDGDEELKLASPSVILVIGVNGVGKTTTIGKLSATLKAEGKTVILAAADTFRAAAIDQLEIWGQRSGVPVIKHQENSDPGAVIFDAIHSAKSKKTDVLICDTAGRLHNKKNLMEELRKIFKIIGREYPEAQLETFIVLDATTGQNALQQATLFKEICDITGIVLTKLDGTAKGGIILSIKNELKIPVRYICIGEGINDMQPFDAKDFASALFTDE